VEALLTYLAGGLATGCSFGLVATGFVAIYRVTRVVNFAQGVFAIMAGFMAWWLLRRGIPHVAAEAIAIVFATLVGLVVGLVATGKPGTQPLASLIVTLGLAILSYAVIILIWGDQPVSFDGLRGRFELGGVTLQRQYGLIVLVTGVTFSMLAFFFGRTYIGKALTACSSNPYAARLAGINVRRMGFLAFALGGALGGLAGVLVVPLGPIEFDSDVGIAINGFAAAIVGGLLRPWTALAGGVVLGVGEALVAGYYKASYETAMALALIIVIMVWQSSRRPEEAG
jgi:branched-chain amino acid transport system permease protein